MNDFTKNDPHQTGFQCECGSGIMETINDDNPHGMSALNDEYDYVCYSCRKLMKSSHYVTEPEPEEEW